MGGLPRPPSAAARTLAAASLLLSLLQPGGTFELKCYQGANEVQPAHESLGGKAMEFPNLLDACAALRNPSLCV
jgi:hypothetical protein